MSRPAPVPTPASCHRRPTAVVLGAGIAGLTAAHELVERGFAVTVYEPRADERAEVDPAHADVYPPVKLGGLAGSQYSTPGPAGGSRAELRPFPGRRGRPRPPRRAVAGEHGFRFFPAYYLHIWDLLQRIPLYQRVVRVDGGGAEWRPTARTVMDNVRRVITQATILHGRPALIFPREQPRSVSELVTVLGQLRQFGFTTDDVTTFAGRVLRYLVTSPLRRASELQNLSAYDYFIGRDATTARRHTYSPGTEALILDMPKVLAAFDSHWGDARTNITTFLQLLLRMDRRDDKADGVLNGPTTEAWFDHWYHHLTALGVRFVPAAVDHLEAPAPDPRRPPHLRPRVRVVLADGSTLAADYVVAAVDAPAAERITGALRAAGTGGAVADLDGFATSAPPSTGPLQPAAQRSAARRDPFVMAETGRVPWDRFQTLAGIQYYFDTEFQLVRGHVFYSGTEWGLSSINQHGMWEQRPSLTRDGFVSVLSVDIGDFNSPSRHLVDPLGRGKAARDCTPDELAAEVWRQIVTAISSSIAAAPETLVPWPAWYALDRNLVMAAGAGQGVGRAVRNEAPYLIPIVGDWPNRPGADPWNPNGTSWTTRTVEQAWLDDLEERGVWQARHGGYQVHHNSLVFAGTWTKTFTRMTTMEAACESGRHAVNAVLDHYLWAQSGGADRRESPAIDWRLPFGFVDQGFSVPVRQPSPAGDYCFVFDVENREPLETRELRNLDSSYTLAALPHPLDLPGPPGPAAAPPPLAGGPPMTSPNDYTGQLLSYLQAWRQYLEQATATAMPPPAWPATPGPTWPAVPQVPPMPVPPMPMPPMPVQMPVPPMPQVPPAAPAPPGSPVPPMAAPAGAAGPALYPPPAYTSPATAEPVDPQPDPPTPWGAAPPAAASAYSWAGQPDAVPAADVATGVGSLFSEPASTPPPPTWWERDDPSPDVAFTDLRENVTPPNPDGSRRGFGDPAASAGTRTTETLTPINQGGTSMARPPRQLTDLLLFGPLRLPTRLSPGAVRFLPPGRTETIGGDRAR